MIAVPVVAFTAALPWANSERRRQTEGPALALRLTAVYFVIGGLSGAAALGLFTRSIGPALTMIGLGSMGLMSAVLMMRDGSLLARARPLDRWEAGSLGWFLVGSALAGVAVLVDAAIATHNRPALAVIVSALAVPVAGGAVATIAMLRG